MSFDTWCSNEFLSKEARDNFRDWLLENGFSITLYRRNKEWWELWREYMKEKSSK